MFQVCDNRKHMEFRCGFGEPLSRNCSTLVSLRVKWAQSEFWRLVVEKCADNGGVCNNLPVLFHLQMSQACDLLSVGSSLF